MADVLALDIKGLKKTYPNGFEALKGIDLSVGEGEFFALLGPNGVGKSTLINILAGLVSKSAGSVKIFGADLDRERERCAMQLGIVPQEVVCDPFITVRETLLFQSGYYGIRHNEAWIDTMLEALGLEEKALTPARLLSGGMKRRLLITQALVHRPPVIVLDEPTAGVDVELRRRLWDFVGELHRKGHTVILTTHYLQEAQNLCSRVAIVNHGRVVTMGQTQSLLSAYRQNTVRFRLDQGTLPASMLPKLLKDEGTSFTLTYTDSADLIEIFAAIKANSLTVQGIVTGQADLEDVFVDILKNS